MSATDVVTGLDLIGRKRDGRPRPIACCPRCSEPTPLIGTIAFYRAEFYCLDCGARVGFLSPRVGEPTPELQAKLAAYEAEWEEHAGAKLYPEGHEPDDEDKLAAHRAALDWLGARITR